LRASVQKEPANATYHHHLGLALAKSGDIVNARKALERALTLQPDFAGAHEARTVLESLPRPDSTQ
jgi:Flp pilus assembly protein TadD